MLLKALDVFERIQSIVVVEYLSFFFLLLKSQSSSLRLKILKHVVYISFTGIHLSMYKLRGSVAVVALIKKTKTRLLIKKKS